MNAIDLPELITHSEEEFENLALDFANNKNKLNQVKVKLEKNKISNSLFNTKLYTKNIESSYKIIYDRYLKDLPVEDVEI